MTDNGPTTATIDDEDEHADEVASEDDESTEDGAHELEPRDAADQARRIDRLRRSLLAVDPADLKRAVKGLPQPSVETLAKAARVRVPVLRAGSIKSLRRVDDPVLLDLLAGIVSDSCLGAIRERLGDEADDPRPEAVTAAVDEIIDQEYPAATVRLTLAMVAAGLAEASDTCDRLLDTDPRLVVPEETDEAPAPTVVSAGVRQAAASDEKRAARRARQAEEAERRKAQQEQAAAAAEARKADRRRGGATASEDADTDLDDDADADRYRSAVVAAPAGAAAAPGADARAGGAPDRADRVYGGISVAPPVAVEEPQSARRRPALVGEEAARFNPEDPLVGSVVIAEIVFDPDDPELEPGAKRRPCVVIGVSPTYLLVRPGYSGGSRSRDWTSHQLRDWRAAGLDRASWIESHHRRVDRDHVDEPLGRLSDDDWNALW